MLTGSAQAAAFRAGAPADINPDVLQFALNLEYLEAEYYLYATTGAGLPADDIQGTGTLGTTIIKDNPKVPFTTRLFSAYAKEIASDELAHVEYLRATLPAFGEEPVARPPLDLLNSFNTLAQAAGIGDSFDPFANEINFLLGAFIFEDVGVTAYRGGAGLLTDPTVVSAAAGILGVEAYHAANIRTSLLALDDSSVTDTVQKSPICATCSTDGATRIRESPATASLTWCRLIRNSLVFARTTDQVLSIVYEAIGAHSGLFFPNGLNGNIT